MSGKKIIFSLGILLTALSFTSCTDSKEKLAADLLCVQLTALWYDTASSIQLHGSILSSEKSKKEVNVFSKETDDQFRKLLDSVSAPFANKDIKFQEKLLTSRIQFENLASFLWKQEPKFMKACHAITAKSMEMCGKFTDGYLQKECAKEINGDYLKLRDTHTKIATSMKSLEKVKEQQQIERTKIQSLMALARGNQVKQLKTAILARDKPLDRTILKEMYTKTLIPPQVNALNFLNQKYQSVVNQEFLMDQFSGVYYVAGHLKYIYSVEKATFDAMGYLLLQTKHLKIDQKTLEKLSNFRTVSAAIRKNSQLFVQGILARGLSKNAKGKHGDSLIAQAAEQSADNVLRLLLKTGVSPNSVNRLKTPLLHIAIREQNIKGAQILLKAGALTNKVREYGSFGDTILAAARSLGNPKMIQLIESYTKQGE